MCILIFVVVTCVCVCGGGGGGVGVCGCVGVKECLCLGPSGVRALSVHYYYYAELDFFMGTSNDFSHGKLGPTLLSLRDINFLRSWDFDNFCMATLFAISKGSLTCTRL